MKGWGTTAFLGSSSPSLREVEVPIWNNQACLQAIGKNVFNTTLCAGGRIKSADACQVYIIRASHITLSNFITYTEAISGPGDEGKEKNHEAN